MSNVLLPFPELMAIAATRGLLGFGIGLLLAEQFSPQQRQAIGWGAVAIGALSTVPLAYDVLSRRRPARMDRSRPLSTPELSHA